jgi:methylated-DNA-[protein]-cysteine S-methyltransferase
MSNFVVIGKSDTPIGRVQVTAGEAGLREVCLLGSQPMIDISSDNENQRSKAYAVASQALKEIIEYLSGKRTTFDVFLDWSAVTPFQKRVLEAASQIPYGEIRRYGEIAKSLGSINASRATGAALGKNPMPIIIPCHRVVAANGHLTGFSAADGIRTKQWLLELEGHKIVDKKLA